MPGPATLELKAAEARAYLAAVRSLLAVARAGAQYPDPRRVDAFLSLLGPDGSRGRRSVVSIERASGLPALHELIRVRADREVAGELLQGPGRRSARRTGLLNSLLDAELPPVSAAEVRLVGRVAGGARFLVVRDQVDLHGSGFVRFTARLVQRGAAYIALERADLARPSEDFLRQLERCSATDVELAFLLLAELPGLAVEDVVRGQVGPVNPFAPAPEPLAGVLAASPGAAVLHLALERAGPGVAEDRCPDPFSRFYRKGLGPAARVAAEERRAALGYRVSKERRLCCTPDVEAPLRAALSARGCPLVIRSR